MFAANAVCFLHSFLQLKSKERVNGQLVSYLIYWPAQGNFKLCSYDQYHPRSQKNATSTRLKAVPYLIQNCSHVILRLLVFCCVKTIPVIDWNDKMNFLLWIVTTAWVLAAQIQPNYSKNIRRAWKKKQHSSEKFVEHFFPTTIIRFALQVRPKVFVVASICCPHRQFPYARKYLWVIL